MPRLPRTVPDLGAFLRASRAPAGVPVGASVRERKGSYFIETYGCQMNVADSEIVESILHGAGYHPSESITAADAILINTCSIREKAEDRIWSRLRDIKSPKSAISNPNASVAVLGCMAERLKEKLLETDKLADVVVGPDAYRDLPRLLNKSFAGESGMNTLLSLEETYADITPLRTQGQSAFVSITRGCNNMCSYCIVPFTRGRERSRPVDSIVEEVRQLSQQGFKEVTLLGQNVNSYNDTTTTTDEAVQRAEGFKTIYKSPKAGVGFAELLARVADVDPEMRVRYTSPHPKDFTDDVLDVIVQRHNVCNQIHIPAQSGNSDVLERMRRGYTREAYLALIDRMKAAIPDVALSSDFIAGFCGETEEEHQDTVTLMEAVQFDQAFMFAYSQREKTHAHRRLQDDVPKEVKLRRLQEIIDTFDEYCRNRTSALRGNLELALVEGDSKRSAEDVSGRIDSNRRIILPKMQVPDLDATRSDIAQGEYVVARVHDGSRLTLQGSPLLKMGLEEFHHLKESGKLQDVVERYGMM